MSQHKQSASLLTERFCKHSKWNPWTPTNSTVWQDKAQGLYQQPDKKLMLKTHHFLLSDLTCYCFWSLYKGTQNCNSMVMRTECEWGVELCLAFPSPKPAPSEACWVAVTVLGLYGRGWHTTKHLLIPHSFWERMCYHSAKTWAAGSNVFAHAWPMCRAEDDQHLSNPATSTCTLHPCHVTGR